MAQHKKFGQAHNILGPLKGQGISQTEMIINTVLTFGTIKKSEMFFILSEKKELIWWNSNFFKYGFCKNVLITAESYMDERNGHVIRGSFLNK